MKYYISITLADGTCTRLTHRNKSAWGLRTARKHAGDIKKTWARDLLVLVLPD